MPYTYPHGVLDSPPAVIEQLGTFWSRLYADYASVDAIVAGRLELSYQTLDAVNEAADAVGRFTIPALHTVRWWPIVLLASQKTIWDAPNSGVAFPVPVELVHAPLICDDILDASVVLCGGVDQWLDHGQLVFRDDPFHSTYFVSTPVYDANGVQIDTQILVWIRHAGFDRQLIYQQFGYVVGVLPEFEPLYRNLVNVMWTALSQGTSIDTLERLLNLQLGVRLPSETQRVEIVGDDSLGRLVVTDRDVYRFVPDADVLVVPGDTVVSGQPLTPAVTVYDLAAGRVPDLAALTLPETYLHPSVGSGLTFVNENVALTATVAEDGHTVATFAIEGDAAAVMQFFALMDERGLANGRTLARALDTRTIKTGDTLPAHLPATINPMQFVCQNVLRYHTLIAVLDASAGGLDPVGATQDALIRQLLPPEAAVLVVHV